MDKIRPWLWLGKYQDTKDHKLLVACQIDAMLELAGEVKQPGIDALYLNVIDGVPLFDLHLKRGLEFVMRHKEQAHRILVACGAGVSRSPAFVVASLVVAEKLPVLNALIEVKHFHPDTMIHPVLWASLCEYFDEEVSYDEVFRIMAINYEI